MTWGMSLAEELELIAAGEIAAAQGTAAPEILHKWSVEVRGTIRDTYEVEAATREDAEDKAETLFAAEYNEADDVEAVFTEGGHESDLRSYLVKVAPSTVHEREIHVMAADSCEAIQIAAGNVLRQNWTGPRLGVGDFTIVWPEKPDTRLIDQITGAA